MNFQSLSSAQNTVAENSAETQADFNQTIQSQRLEGQNSLQVSLGTVHVQDSCTQGKTNISNISAVCHNTFQPLAQSSTEKTVSVCRCVYLAYLFIYVAASFNFQILLICKQTGLPEPQLCWHGRQYFLGDLGFALQQYAV